jgi:uroporphyrinogen decarboxylase
VIQTIFNPLPGRIWLVGRCWFTCAAIGQCTPVCKLLLKTRRFTEAALETGISGIFYAVQHAQFGLLSRQEYQQFGRAYDLQVLEPRMPCGLTCCIYMART